MAFSLTFFADQQLAEEAVQEILSEYGSEGKLDESKSFKSYLFQAVKFYIFNYIRDRKKDCSLDSLSGDFGMVSESLEDSLSYKELEGMMMEQIERLPSVQKEVLN